MKLTGVYRHEQLYTGTRGQRGDFLVHADWRVLQPNAALRIYGNAGVHEFGWGYRGGGPRLLAVGILDDFFFNGDDETVLRVYPDFMRAFVECWDMYGSWSLPGADIEAFLRAYPS